MRLTFATPLLLPLVAACTTIPQTSAPPRPPLRPDVETQVPPPARPAPPPMVGPRTPQILRAPGLEAVIEHGAQDVQRLFGTPRLDVYEGDMRKLQFSGEACVLDVFLYPLRPGADPVATHVEARRSSDGREVDRAACVAALRRR